MAIEIRLLKEDEIALANDFFNSIYKTNRSLDNFKWEFVNGPSGPAVYVVAIDDSITTQKRIVGIQCAIPIELSDAKGNIILTAKSEDTLVDPAYRGQKIFERMYELLFDECRKAGIKFIWGFTPAKKAFERIGFEIPFQAHQGLMVFNPFRSYSHLSKLNPQNKLIDKVKITGLTFLSMITSIKLSFIASLKLRIEEVSMNSVMENIRAYNPHSKLYFLNMNKEYLDWRIARNPYHNQYENYQVYSNDKFRAEVIVNFREHGLSYIESIHFADHVSHEHRKGILLAIVKQMRKRSKFIRLLCFGTNEELQLQEDFFRQCGFVILKRGGHFVWKSLTETKLDPNNLYLTRLFTQGNQ